MSAQLDRAGFLERAAAQRRKNAILRWLRKVHGWLGLWGAVFGFLFGATGIVLAHRAVLKLPVTKVEQSVVQYRLATQPSTAKDLAERLSREFGFEGREPRLKVEPARPVAWSSGSLAQPERWELAFDHPKRGVRVEYFVGKAYARVERVDATWIGTLTRLHMATGVDAFWVLLIDTFAGSLMALSLTGTLLWTQLRLPRLAAACGLLGAPVLAALWLAVNP
ncbi:MAG TPA: PepSY-associated TM helix domain-containing protein [Ramlibacter sp.]